MKKLVCFVALAVIFAGMDDAFARGGRGGGRSGGGNVSRGGASSLSSRGGSSRNFSPGSSSPGTRGNLSPSGQGNFSGKAQNIGSNRPNSSQLSNIRGNVQSGGQGSVRSNFGGQTPKSGELQNFLNLPAGSQGTKLSESFKARSPFEKGTANSEKFQGKADQFKNSEQFQSKTEQFKNSEQFQAKSEQFQGKKEELQGNFETVKSDKQQAWSDKKSEWSDKKNEVADQVRNEYEELTKELEDQPLYEDLNDAYNDYYDDWAYMYEQYPGYFWMQAAQWGAIGAWVLNEAVEEPYAYNYGTSVYTEGDTVYYEGEPVATTEEYADEATQIATARPESAPANIEWMPLGMYVVKTSADSTDEMIIQLSVSQEGYLMGTYYDQKLESAIPIEGTVDKSSQRAAWKLADGVSPMVMETGIYDLTQDETVVMVHFGNKRTEQWLLVRLSNPEAEANATAVSSN